MNINGFDGAATIPGRAGRKALIIYVHPGGGNVWMSFSPSPVAADTVTAEANTGVPLPADELITFVAELDKAFQGPIYLLSDNTTTVTYQESF